MMRDTEAKIADGYAIGMVWYGDRGQAVRGQRSRRNQSSRLTKLRFTWTVGKAEYYDSETSVGVLKIRAIGAV